MNVFKKFGLRLAKLRRAKKWSQEELAYHADIHRNYLSDLENGRRNPSLDVLVRLANALNISLEFLLKGIFSPSDF